MKHFRPVRDATSIIHLNGLAMIGNAKILGHQMDIPVVASFRVKGWDNDILCFVCPFCGEEHIHGACGKDSPFGYGDGHRLKHCRITNDENHNGYWIKESTDPLDAGYKWKKDYWHEPGDQRKHQA